jgi:hypothetical protein
MVIPQVVLFIVRDCLHCPRFVLYHIIWEFLYLCKELSWNFDGDCIETLDYCVCRIAIFILLIWSNREHGRYFHLLWTSSISVSRNFKFLSNWLFTWLVRVISRNFICDHFEEFCFPTFLLSPFILIVRKADDFFEIIFYWATFAEVVY